jgi:hypothetical protein
MIAVPCWAQPVTGEQAVEDPEPQKRASLPGQTGLRIRGVGPGRGLDDERRKTEETQRKQHIVRRSIPSQGGGSPKAQRPLAREGEGQAGAREGEETMASRVHCRGHYEQKSPKGPFENPTERRDVEPQKGGISNRHIVPIIRE